MPEIVVVPPVSVEADLFRKLTLCFPFCDIISLLFLLVALL